jgi:hypothetical protein
VPVHVVFDHQCAACEADYIPYDRDVPCPRCGAVEAERFDFIRQAAKSLRFNKAKDGTFLPPAWWATSLGDQLLGLLFPLFETSDVDRPADFDEFAKSWLASMDWGHRPYLKNHVLGMARRLADELAKPVATRNAFAGIEASADIAPLQSLKEF